MQGTTKLFRFALLGALIFALFESNTMKLYAEEPETFYILDEANMIKLLEAKKDSFKLDVKDFRYHKDGTSGSFNKKAISDIVRLETDSSGIKSVHLVRTGAKITELRLNSKGNPQVVVGIDDAGKTERALGIPVDGENYNFYYSYPRGALNYADMKDKFREFLLSQGFKIDANGNLISPKGTNLGSFDKFADDMLKTKTDSSSDRDSRSSGRGSRSSDSGLANSTGRIASDRSSNSRGHTSQEDDGLTPFERGLRQSGGGMNLNGGLNLGGAGLGVGPGINMNGLNGLQNLIIALRGANLNPNDLFAQFSSDPDLAKIIAGIKDGSKTKQDLMDYLRTHYGIQDGNILAQLGDLLSSGRGLNLDISAGQNGASNPNDLSNLLAALLGGNGGNLNLGLNGGNGDLASILAALGLGSNGSGNSGSLGLGLNIGGLGDLLTILGGSGIDPTQLQKILQLIQSGASDADIRAALAAAGITDPNKLNDLMNAISKYRLSLQNPGSPSARGSLPSATGQFSSAEVYSFTEIPETGELQVRNPDGSYAWYKIENRGGKKVAVDDKGNIVFEFDNGWKKLGAAKNPSASNANPSNPDLNLDPEVRFLIEAGINPQLISTMMPSSGRIRGVWGDSNGKFWMAGYQNPVSIDANNPDATKKANQEEVEKLNFLK